MDIIICVNHGKMDGTNIVVNATIFNDSLNEFRFNIDNGDWVYVDRIEETNKTQDVMFMGLNQDITHNIICHTKTCDEWSYSGNIVTSTHTNDVVSNVVKDKEIEYTYSNHPSDIGVCEISGVAMLCD